LQKKAKFRRVFGLDWIVDALDILKACGISAGIVMDVGASCGQKSKRLARAFLEPR
jgi:hypothetical protein